MKWVVSFLILSRFGPRGRLDAMFMGRGDGVEVDAGAATARERHGMHAGSAGASSTSWPTMRKMITL